MFVVSALGTPSTAGRLYGLQRAMAAPQSPLSVVSIGQNAKQSLRHQNIININKNLFVHIVVIARLIVKRTDTPAYYNGR